MLYVKVTYIIRRIKKEKTVSASVRIHNAQTKAKSMARLVYWTEKDTMAVSQKWK